MKYTTNNFSSRQRIKPLTGSGAKTLTIEFKCHGNADDELAAERVKEFLIFNSIQALAEKL